MNVPRRMRKVVAVAAASTLIVIGLAASASAYGGESGKLLIHGPGTAFTSGGGNGSIVSIATTAGGTASFAFEVKNTGTSTAQFNLTVADFLLNCTSGNCGGSPTLVLTSGSVIGTPLAQGPNGYFTPPIAPGKTGTFTLKATLSKTAPGGSEWYQILQLNDSAHTELSYSSTVETVSAAKANAGDDQIVTGAGSQKPVVVAGGTTYVTDPSAAAGAKSVYTVKLENDSAAATQISYQLTDESSCAVDFPISVKAGTADVTAAVLGGTYKTPVLATGKSTALTVTVTFDGNGNYCGQGTGSDYWLGISGDGVDPSQIGFLVTNPVAS